jgi:hypothetical protein
MPHFAIEAQAVASTFLPVAAFSFRPAFNNAVERQAY